MRVWRRRVVGGREEWREGGREKGLFCRRDVLCPELPAFCIVCVVGFSFRNNDKRKGGGRGGGGAKCAFCVSFILHPFM